MKSPSLAPLSPSPGFYPERLSHDSPPSESLVMEQAEIDSLFDLDLWTDEYLQRFSAALERELIATLSSPKPKDQASRTNLFRLIRYAKNPEILDKLEFKATFWSTLPAIILKQYIETIEIRRKATTIQALTDYIAVGNLSILLMGHEKRLSQEKVAQLAGKILTFSLHRLLEHGTTMLPLGWSYTNQLAEKVGHYCVAVLQKIPPRTGQQEDLYKIKICEGTKCDWYNPQKFGELWKQYAYRISEEVTIEEVKDYLIHSFSYLFEQLRPSYTLEEVQKALYNRTSLLKRQTWIVVPDRHACTVESLRASLYALGISSVRELFDNFREHIPL